MKTKTKRKISALVARAEWLSEQNELLREEAQQARADKGEARAQAAEYLKRAEASQCRTNALMRGGFQIVPDLPPEVWQYSVRIDAREFRRNPTVFTEIAAREMTDWLMKKLSPPNFSQSPLAETERS